MTPLAPALQAHFTDRLLCQRRVSPNTVASYRDAFRLLLGFVHEKTGTPPSRLELTQLDAPTIGAFLEHLEHDCGNSTRTRNIRLAAVHSFFATARCASPSTPRGSSGCSRSRRNAPRSERSPSSPAQEVSALLAAPDRQTWAGRRDHALLLTDVQTGLRVSTRRSAERGYLATVRALRRCPSPQLMIRSG